MQKAKIIMPNEKPLTPPGDQPQTPAESETFGPVQFGGFDEPDPETAEGIGGVAAGEGPVKISMMEKNQPERVLGIDVPKGGSEVSRGIVGDEQSVGDIKLVELRKNAAHAQLGVEQTMRMGHRWLANLEVFGAQLSELEKAIAAIENKQPTKLETDGISPESPVSPTEM